MILLSFDTWNSAHGKRFTRERIYRHGWQWTPFVRIKWRYKS